MSEKKKFYEMNLGERLKFLQEQAGLTDEEKAAFGHLLPFEIADRMIENAVGAISIPVGIAMNFLINGQERLIPMAIEEPSVIAAASKAAKIARAKGGFTASATESHMIGQIQVVSLGDIERARQDLESNRQQILDASNSKTRSIKAHDLLIRQVQDESPNDMGNMLVVEITADARDAMGANAVNTMCESAAEAIAEISGGHVVLRILSNYSTKRMVKCSAIFDKDELGGPDVVERILYAYALAYSDIYRAVTHNKGIMNGIDAVALATGQDFRAIEAAAHAFACKDGSYRSLTHWSKTGDGDLQGELELPLAVGITGGVTAVSATARAAIKVTGAKSSKDLAVCMACAGLAQNLAAIRALASEGIQKGHMRLHARNIAMAAGAKGKEVEAVADRISDAGNITLDAAKKALESLRSA
ncbi:MAG: hydroxymethylglutaryl-CoA reductase, degradative [Nitrososphaera sp.]